jgi:anti-anti-sigma factor
MIAGRSDVRAQEVAVLRVEGEFDASNVARFSDKVGALIDGGYRGLVLDLRALRFADGVMAGRLVAVRETFRMLGGDVVLVEPTPFVRRTVRVLGFDGILRFARSEIEALRMLVRPPAGTRAEDPAVAALRITRVS